MHKIPRVYRGPNEFTGKMTPGDVYLSFCTGFAREARLPFERVHGESVCLWCAGGADGVIDGTRTRNIQNHNLGLYH